MRSLMLSAAALAMLAASPALAEDPFPPITDSVAKGECAECHMPYQPEMLTQKAWQHMLTTLDDHFGENAALPPDLNKQVLDYYLANAADVTSFKDASRFLRRVDPENPPMKITDVPRVVRKHDRIAEDVFKRKNVRFRGNCVACHTDAVTKGDYEKIAPNLMYTWVEE